jgi:hypothetical protein
MTTINIGASVRQRLLNRARATNRPFQELLQYYAMERFLFRLSQSARSSDFVLKGGLLLHVWNAPMARATKDVDLLGHMANSLEAVGVAVASICATAVEPDGVMFVASSIQTTRIKEDADYEGVRVKFSARIDGAEVTMQLDVGFGDTVRPQTIMITYPTLLNFAAPRIAGYPRETVIAEKFHAMVYLGLQNSRMKDFYDLWLLASNFTFDGTSLADAIATTFANRKTEVEVAPIAFTEVFTQSATARTQWNAFLKRSNLRDAPVTLHDATELISTFVSPVLHAIVRDRQFVGSWQPVGLWTLAQHS